MRWCQEHWDGLRAEVEKQGATGLVPDSGREAAEKFSRLVEGEESVDTFDPLMGAMWAINTFIGNQMGPGGLLTVLAYDGCPVCKADEMHDVGCPEPDCTLTYSRFFPNAVADEVARWHEMKH